MKKSLTDLEAYKAMFCFLEKYYNQTGSDNVGSLLYKQMGALNGKQGIYKIGLNPDTGVGC